MFRLRSLWIILPYGLVYWGVFSLQNAWGALIFFHIALLPVLFSRREAILQAFMVPITDRRVWLVPLSGLLGGISLWVIWSLLGVPENFFEKLKLFGFSEALWVPFIVYFSLVNPWLEEAYWRFIFVSQSRYPATIDVLFAGYHLIVLSKFVGLPWLIFAFVVLLVVSWFWRVMSKYSKSLLPITLAHLLADSSILLVIYLFSKHQN